MSVRMHFFTTLFEKYRNTSCVAKAALWYTVSIAFQKGFTFFTVPIFTRVMTKEQYGLFSVYLSWISVLTILATMEFHTCAYINGLAKIDSDKDKNELAISLLNLSFITTFAWFIVYLLCYSFWNRVLGLPTSIVIMMFVELIFIPAMSFWIVKQRYTYKYKVLVAITVSQAFLNGSTGICFVLMANKEYQAQARVFSIMLVQTLFGLSMLIYFFRKAPIAFSTKFWRSGLRLHLPLIPHRLSLAVLSSADKVMIRDMVSVAATATYSVAYSATMSINIIKLSINDALTPWIYTSLKNKDYSAIKRNTVFVMLLVMTMAFLFILFAPEIIYIVGSRKYMEAIYVIPPVAASVFFTFLYNLFSSVEFYYEKTKAIMVASLTAAVANILLNLIFIKLFGFIAAGYTTLVCYMLLSIAHFRIMKNAVTEEVDVNNLFNLKAIIGLSAIVLCSMFFCIFLYSNNVLRYITIIILLATLTIMSNKIITLIKTIKMK